MRTVIKIVLVCLSCWACKPVARAPYRQLKVNSTQVDLRVKNKNGRSYLAVCNAMQCENALLRQNDGEYYYFTSLEAISKSNTKDRMRQIFIWTSFIVACATTISLSKSGFTFLKRKLSAQWSKLSNEKLISDGASTAPDMKVEMAAEAHAELIDGIPRDVAVAILNDIDEGDRDFDRDRIEKNLTLVEKVAPQYQQEVTELRKTIKDGELELATEKSASLANRVKSELSDRIGIPSVVAFVSALVLRKGMEDKKYAHRKEDFMALVRDNQPMRVNEEELRTLLTHFAKVTNTSVNQFIFLLF